MKGSLGILAVFVAASLIWPWLSIFTALLGVVVAASWLARR